MRIVGLYPPEKNSRLFKVYAYILYFIALTPTSVLGFLDIYLKEDVDVVEMSYSALISIQMAFFTMKLSPFIRNGNKIKKCINYFESPNFDLFNKEHKKIIEESVDVCRRNSVVFLGGVIVSFCFWSVTPFWRANNLPLDVWVPFDPFASVINYCIVYSVLAVGLAYGALASAGVDPLIGGLAYHAAGQLKILKNNLQYLDEHAEEEVSKMDRSCFQREAMKFEIIYNKIGQAINHHKAILLFFKEYEECFSLPVFSQFMASTLIFGMCCLRLSRSNSLITAIYMGKWYEYNIKSKKALIILMESFKRPMVATAGTIFDLSLDTFSMSKTLSTAVYMGEWYEYDMKIKKALITLMEGSKKPMRATAGK
ncbi:7tm 6 and/or Iso dh domain containing protein, partial [Asbolus verrucosus]